MDKAAVGGMDPHKLSIAIGLVDGFGADLIVASFDNTGDGLQQALLWLARQPGQMARIGIEARQDTGGTSPSAEPTPGTTSANADSSHR